MKRVSILNEVELHTGTNVYVQINGERGSMTIETTEISQSIWLTLDELQGLADIIKKSLEQAKE